jgi:hypothetical protein
MQSNRLKKDLIEWRREQVLKMRSLGSNMTDIAKTLKVDVSTISRDMAFLRVQAKENIKQYLNDRLPMEYEKCLTGLTSILEEAWNTSKNTQDNGEKIQALSLAKECYGMKLDLLTNVSVVDDVIKFVESKEKKMTFKDLKKRIVVQRKDQIHN